MREQALEPLVIERHIRKYTANGDVINRFIELWYFEIFKNDLLTARWVNLVSSRKSVLIHQSPDEVR